MNKYHLSINLTVEVNPSKILDTKIYRYNDEIKCVAYHKEMKLLFHWTSAVLKHYKKNVLIGDLHHVKNLSSNFEQEIRIMRNKYIKAGYPFHFVNSVIDSFIQEKEDPIIPLRLFEERKEVSFQIPSCKRNENEIYRINDKLEEFTNYKVKFRYFWKTSKVRSLFVLKDPVLHRVNVTYKSICSCSEFYVGETKRNTEVRWREHCSTKKMSKVGDHLLMNPGQMVNWEVLANAPKQVNKRKILEACYILTPQPTLNNQLNTKRTLLFRNEIT